MVEELKPRWATDHMDELNHFYIPPRSGRGNHSDAWTSVCGIGTPIMPWRLDASPPLERKSKCLACWRISPDG